MVLIGGVKYACERCIRGHRVTTCNHTDQPLIMIKPKGRPSSQCKHCKNMRVNKNSHSTGACTCSNQNSNGVKKKKCGCESGKTCDCHKKRKELKKKNQSTDSLLKPSDYIDSVDGKKRVGEVSIPIDEYAPKHPQHEIGNVLNERAVSGFFQDVPLPFEPGHGLLDLFEPSSSSISTISTTTSNMSRSQVPMIQQRYTSPFPVHQSPRPSVNRQKSSNAPKSNNEFDVFQNLVLTPNSATPTSTTPNYNRNYTQGTRITESTSPIEKPLFGNYANFNHKRNKSVDNLSSKVEVEVLSLTPSFNDIMPEYDNYGTIPKEQNEKHPDVGIDNELKNIQNGKENEFQQMLKF